MTQRALSLDVLFHPERPVDFDDRHRRQWRWTDWGAAIGIPSSKSTLDRTAVVVDPTTGAENVLYDLDVVGAAASPEPRGCHSSAT